MRRRRRARRAIAVAAMGLTPIVALGWAGCSDDETTPVGPTYVDPGGTFGAELTLSVIGRGRVTTSGPGVDCPTDCFAKYIFTSATADGAAGAVSLKAIPTPGSRFKGWSFSTEPVGSRGRGPSNCNPVLRAGTDPAIDKSALEIALPYGETAGTAPAGQEGACGGFTQVPLVYNVTATFDTDPPIPDGGPDGGVLDPLFNPPALNAVGKEIGITQSGYLYWHFTSGGLSGIAYDSSPTAPGPRSAQVIVSPTTSITRFEVDPSGVVYQNSLGTVSVIRNGFASPTTMGGSAPTCRALAIDSSYNVYCRTTSTIVQWDYPSYTAPVTLYSGLPSGDDLVAESSFGALYFSASSSIQSLPVSGADGSIAAPTTIVSSTFGSFNLEANTSHLFWLESDGHAYASSSKTASSTRYDTGVPPSTGYRYIAQDPSSSSFFWVASSSAIYHAYAFGGAGQSTPLRTGLSGIAGIAAYSSYVFTSQTDGTVRRATNTPQK